ncbi:helix-turn-helix domain-containing protein [uncultured Thiodictyon sp.]|uniref:helix-turn-helix domain-containing protein n=1 Tax=uncultured Thiodictyon sp. TaxID=1846217 RepID=UPI0025E1294C|nr:helix-turn-helix domain-containing protein [uncultured Thiodictyon sp.]
MTTALQDDDDHPPPSAHPGTTACRATDLHVVQTERADPLSKCVEDAVANYLRNMDGHAITDLYRLVIEEVERPLFETVLRSAQGNLTLAARILGLTRSTLRKRLAHHNITR